MLSGQRLYYNNTILICARESRLSHENRVSFSQAACVALVSVQTHKSVVFTPRQIVHDAEPSGAKSN